MCSVTDVHAQSFLNRLFSNSLLSSHVLPLVNTDIHSFLSIRSSLRWSIRLKISAHVLTCLGGIFDHAVKKDRLKEVELELAEPSVWDNPEKAQALGRERASLEVVVATIETLDAGCDDASDLLDLAVEEDDKDTADAVEQDLAGLEVALEKLE